MSPEEFRLALLAAVKKNINHISTANIFSGGCERWLQLVLLLRFVQGGWTPEENIFQEATYTDPVIGKSDILIRHKPESE